MGDVGEFIVGGVRVGVGSWGVVCCCLVLWRGVLLMFVSYCVCLMGLWWVVVWYCGLFMWMMCVCFVVV